MVGVYPSMTSGAAHQQCQIRVLKLIDGHIAHEILGFSLTLRRGEDTITGQRVAYTRVSSLDQNADRPSPVRTPRWQTCCPPSWARSPNSNAHWTKERQREGIALAKSAAPTEGRIRSLSEEQAARLRQRASGGVPKTTLACGLGISCGLR